MNKVIYKGTQYNSGDIIENGIVINDGNAVVEGTDTTTTVIRSGGKRYYYGDQGQRIVCRGHIVLMPYNFSDDDYATVAIDTASPYKSMIYHEKTSDGFDLNNVQVGNSTQWQTEEVQHTQAIDTNSSLRNLIRPSDLYNEIYIRSQGSSLAYTAGSPNHTYILKANSSYYLVSIGYRSDSPEMALFRVPKTATTMGQFLLGKEIGESGVMIRTGFAAFDDTQTEIIDGVERSKLVALFPIAGSLVNSPWNSNTYLSWKDTNEYQYAISQTQTYSYITKDEYDELTNNG